MKIPREQKKAAAALAAAVNAARDAGLKPQQIVTVVRDCFSGSCDRTGLFMQWLDKAGG